MAHFVLIDAFVLVNAVNLSDNVRSVDVNYSAEMVDDTAMSNLSRIRKGGLKDWSIDLEFYSDFAAADLDASLFPLVGTTFTVEVRPTSAARSATNPAYVGTGILESYTPLSGEVGAMAMSPVTIQGSGILSRATV